MKNKIGIKIRERMLYVTDDWHPCFPGNRIRLKVSLNYFNGYYILLSAWGADDTGVEIFKRTPFRVTAEWEYAKLANLFEKIPSGVDREWFLNHGFTPA